MTIEYKRLAASRPANTTEAELYAAPAATEVIGDLYIANQTANAATFRVAHTDAAGAATSEDWLAYDETLEANSSKVIHVTLGPLETIRIRAGTADAISFLLSGMVKT